MLWVVLQCFFPLLKGDVLRFQAGYRRAKLCVLGAVNAGTFAAAVNLVLTLDPEDR